MISVFIERVPDRVVARSTEEVEEVVRTLLSGPEVHQMGVVVDPHVIADLYSGDVTGDEEDEELSVGWLHVSVHPERRLGALNYSWTDGAEIDSWESRGSVGGEPLLYSTRSGNTFHADTGVTLTVVADAVRELARTGDRPTCVHWLQGVLV
ncbi:Imm1 family immunity protein [Haloactinomyces albus]|uniref:Immunity protein Imm1 n=1 Tax=Haloactinomyces albus TaxID=1352928 RepID=A0AAE3ZBT5_9ACTN|nr:Imm1 family immunity protein [Haloactinomyces albus]MDR7301005.1 hypothetical protein [Haloactinomyces albus]